MSLTTKVNVRTHQNYYCRSTVIVLRMTQMTSDVRYGSLHFRGWNVWCLSSWVMTVSRGFTTQFHTVTCDSQGNQQSTLIKAASGFSNAVFYVRGSACRPSCKVCPIWTKIWRCLKFSVKFSNTNFKQMCSAVLKLLHTDITRETYSKGKVRIFAI